MKRKDAERLLCDLANSHDFPSRDLANAQGFPARYPRLFVGDGNPEETARALRQLLRRAWRSRDQRHREWWCHGIETFYHRDRPDRDLEDRIGPTMTKAMLGEYVQSGSLLFALRKPPRTASALESALLYFKKNSTRARHCPTVDCPAPYFFARKKNQKYCSLACVKPAQRATKRRWWKKHRAK
jgi:hypothetical protein